MQSFYNAELTLCSKINCIPVYKKGKKLSYKFRVKCQRIYPFYRFWKYYDKNYSTFFELCSSRRLFFCCFEDIVNLHYLFLHLTDLSLYKIPIMWTWTYSFWKTNRHIMMRIGFVVVINRGFSYSIIQKKSGCKSRFILRNVTLLLEVIVGGLHRPMHDCMSLKSIKMWDKWFLPLQ